MGKKYILDHFYKDKTFWPMFFIVKSCVSKDYSFRQCSHFNNSSFLVFNYMLFQMISYHTSRIGKLSQSLFGISHLIRGQNFYVVNII